MSTHTPSPHRFLVSKPSSKSKPNPHSSLRNVQTPAPAKKAAPKPELQFKKITPAKRFVFAPSDHAKSAESRDNAWGDSQAPAPRPKPRRKLERVESIEPPSHTCPPHAEGVTQSTEHEATPFDEVTASDDELLFEQTSHTKRRRIFSDSLHAPSLPHAPRFKLAAHTPISATPPKPRPHFILPALPSSPPKTSRPHPELFSPSRKYGKHLPGGLASVVTSWIIETAAIGSLGGGVSWGRNREDGVKIKVRLTHVSTGQGEEVECFAGGVVLVRGEMETGMNRPGSVVGEQEEVRVLLSGQGGARGNGGVSIKRGCVVGIRAPTWEVQVSRETWVVGVDWVVL